MSAKSDLLELFKTISARGTPRTLVDLPRAYRTSNGGLWTVPGYEGYDGPLNTQGATPMADPVEVVDPNIYRVQHILNVPRGGMSETYLYQVTNLQDPLASLKNITEALVKERKKVLHQSVKYDAVRISREDTNGDDERFLTPQISMGPGLAIEAAAKYDDGIGVVSYDASRTIRSNRSYGGWANIDLSTATDADRMRPTSTDRAKAWVSYLTTHLTTNVGTTSTGGSIRAVLSSYDHSDAFPRLAVRTWGIDSNGWLTALLRSGTPTWSMGQKVKLSHVKADCVRRLAGEYRVIANESTTGGQLITLHKKYKCAIDTLAGLVGWLSQRQTAYYLIDRVEFGIYGNRRVGKAFFQEAGHQKGK